MALEPRRLPELARANDYSCLYAPVPKKLHTKILEFQKRIPSSVLVPPGLELDPHVTVKYGIHTENPGVLRALLTGVGPVTYRLGNVSVFDDPPKYDVLKVDVYSVDLRKIHRTVSNDLANSDEFPKYTPHMTLAYVRKGACKDLAGNNYFKGLVVWSGVLRFAPPEGSPHTFRLLG